MRDCCCDWLRGESERFLNSTVSQLVVLMLLYNFMIYMQKKPKVRRVMSPQCVKYESAQTCM